MPRDVKASEPGYYRLNNDYWDNKRLHLKGSLVYFDCETRFPPRFSKLWEPKEADVSEEIESYTDVEYNDLLSMAVDRGYDIEKGKSRDELVSALRSLDVDEALKKKNALSAQAKPKPDIAAASDGKPKAISDIAKPGTKKVDL